MVYITGDTHGDISSFKNPKLKKLSDKDTLIVCGDFGFIWDPKNAKEKKNIETLKKQKYTICFVDGTHENFEVLNSYQPYRWKGGNAHKIAPNIFHLMRGEIFTFETKSFFVLGGGESEDRALRTENVSWWESEMPNAEEIKNAEENLKASEMAVNYILTYEAPAIAKDFLSLHTNRPSEISPLNTYLQQLMTNVDYYHWYFGSLHIDAQISKKMTAVFNNVIPIE